MVAPYTAGGFLYHAATGHVLLHHRDANAPRYPNLWAGFGGICEASDRGDPVATWRREMREELGVELAPEQIVPLWDGVNPRSGRHRYAFYAEWPTRDEDFALTEGDGFGWFALEDALALPDVVDLARDDLLVLRDRVAASANGPTAPPLPSRGQALGTRQQMYLIADELRGMATLTKDFAKNAYDAERGDRMMELAARIATLVDDGTLDDVTRVFADGWPRVSPAVGVDAAVFNERGEILLLRRRDNELWCMPGGLAEIGQTTAEAALHELWEEAGLRGEVARLLGVFDGPRWGAISKVHMAELVYLVRCDDLSPVPGFEMTEAAFFGPDALPSPLYGSHNLCVPICFELARNGRTYFDPASSNGIAMPMHQRPSP